MNTTLTDLTEAELPKEYSIKQNYPNQLNPAIVIEYSIPASPLRENRVG